MTINQKSSLQDWLSYLETLHVKTIDLSLDRIQQVACHLQLLPLSSFVITVAGTNGKGTSVALLEAIFLAAGHQIGSYTSPHLLHYNERTKINGVPVSDAALCEAFAIIEQARGAIRLTYFEFGTLAALWLFKQATLDAIILEVGLGGRLDAVNIVDADIALISTIALDHQEYLGNDREAIGREKAGILRAGKPAVCGDNNTPASIRTYAKQIHAPLFLPEKDFTYKQINEKQWQWQSDAKQFMSLPLPTMPLQNAAAVLKVIELLPAHFNITLKNIMQGLVNVFVAGRFQTIAGAIPCILDVAHNPAAAAWLAEKLKNSPVKGHTFAVIGMLMDKDHQATVKQLAAQITAWFAGSLNVPRGMPAELLAHSIAAVGIEQIHCNETIAQAYRQAMQRAQPGDRIVVFGSFYTVAEIMRLRL